MPRGGSAADATGPVRAEPVEAWRRCTLAPFLRQAQDDREYKLSANGGGSTRAQALPALQRLHQLVVDAGVADLGFGGALGVARVEVGFGEQVGELFLLGFQRLDQARQLVELTLFLVAELAFLRRGVERCGRRFGALGCRLRRSGVAQAQCPPALHLPVLVATFVFAPQPG